MKTPWNFFSRFEKKKIRLFSSYNQKGAIDFLFFISINFDYVGTIGSSNMRLMNDDINETGRKENLKWQ